ncbi:hypothetical protein [Virgibacillus sp. DJP39]|uniref:hypothetical protein n=1 Tax=Virgibacillus sp. DJP39 TaxID=3409790 RepID=UPI003BB5A04C
MITIVAQNQNESVKEVTLEDFKNKSYDWYWVDLDTPSDVETKLLETDFGFHP